MRRARNADASHVLLLHCRFDHRIVMWDVEKLKEMKPFARAHTAAVTQLGLDTFSNYILSSSYDGTVRSWNMEVWVVN